MTPEHERYVWLRDGKSRYGGYCGSAPFVMNPRASRLYAIATFRSQQLDAAVDNDILNNKIAELGVCNFIVERGLLPPGVSANYFDETYCNLIAVVASLELGWDAKRFVAAMTYE